MFLDERRIFCSRHKTQRQDTPVTYVRYISMFMFERQEEYVFVIQSWSRRTTRTVDTCVLVDSRNSWPSSSNTPSIRVVCCSRVLPVYQYRSVLYPYDITPHETNQARTCCHHEVQLFTHTHNVNRHTSLSLGKKPGLFFARLRIFVDPPHYFSTREASLKTKAVMLLWCRPTKRTKTYETPIRVYVFERKRPFCDTLKIDQDNIYFEVLYYIEETPSACVVSFGPMGEKSCRLTAAPTKRTKGQEAPSTYNILTLFCFNERLFYLQEPWN